MKYSTLQAVYLPKTEAEKEALEQVANHAQHYPACVHCACLKNCLSDCALIREDYEETLHPPVDYEAEEEAEDKEEEDNTITGQKGLPVLFVENFAYRILPIFMMENGLVTSAVGMTVYMQVSKYVPDNLA